jgi:hypothetical protein
MVRRSLGAALWSLVGLFACFLGGLSALVGTGTGRALLARIASRVVAGAIDGRIEVGDVSGSLLTGMTLTDVKLYDPDSTLVGALPRVELAYSPFDFAAGRVVLQEVHLTKPYINLVQHKNRRLNLEELLRLGRPDSGPHTPPPLILLRNVRIEDGTVIVRLQSAPAPGDSAVEIELAGPDGRWRIRRFEHVDGKLASLRLSSPAARGIRADVQQLAVAISDPHVHITDLAGRITIVGDSLDADVGRLHLPGSALSVRGHVRWPRDTALYSLDVRADSATLGDVRFLDARFPAATVLRGRVAVRSHGGRVLEVRLDPLALRDGAGTLTGKVTAISAADSGVVALRQADLTSQDFSLEFARPFLDTLPFAGRLSGHTVADGPLSELQLQVDWTFRDSLVPDWPASVVKGAGRVDATAGAGLRFEQFGVEYAGVALATVRRMVPAVTLAGELDAAGTLSGPLLDAQFSGTLRHHDGAAPASVVRGVVRLDGRGDTLGIFADVTADTLSFDGLRGSFPGLPLAGAVAGPVRLAGSVADLETHVDWTAAGEAGRLRFDGRLVLLPDRTGARAATLDLRDVNLARWLRNGPHSRLNFTASGDVVASTSGDAAGAVQARLAPSLFAGTVVDSGAAGVRFAGHEVLVDSLRFRQPGLATTAHGALGLAAPASGELRFDFEADSLNALDSLVAWATHNAATPGAEHQVLRGAARGSLTLAGSLDSLGLAAQVSGADLQWRGWQVTAGRLHAAWTPRAGAPFTVDAALDSLAHDRLGFGAASFAARGVTDSLTWFARSRVGDVGAFLAGGRYARRGDTTAVGVDSLAVLLPEGVWLLDAPAVLVVDDSAARLPALALHSAAGGGTLTARINLPARGSGAANLQLEGFPLAGVYALLEADTTGVAGTVTATLGVTGTRAAPLYTGSFSLSNGAIGDFRIPFLDGSVNYRDRRLDAAAHLWREGRQILSVDAHLPLDLALVPVAHRQVSDTLAVRATGDSVDLSVLEAITPVLRAVSGTATLDVGIGGTWDDPRLQGRVAVAQGAATLPTLGARYEGVSGRFTLAGDTIRVDTLDVRSDRGRAAVAGFVRLERLTRPVLGLAIRAQNFKALDIPYYLTLTTTGDLTLTGPVIGATLRGSATVPNGVLHFADLVNKRIVNFDEPWAASLIDTSLADVIRRQQLGPAFESVFFDSLRIDNLQLTMGSDAWLRSNEANIQLTGGVTVSKRRAVYEVTGTLQAPRGTYRLVVPPLSREFVVTRGTVRYFGTPDLDAALDIEATHVVHPVPGRNEPACTRDCDITVTARITGTLLVPRLALEADRPGMSQTEIISYLLFGKPSFELSNGQGGLGGQSAVLRSAVANVVSGQLERTLVSDLGVPLDYVQINLGDPADPLSGTQVEAGWQIGRKTFLVVNAGFCPNHPVAVSNTLGASLQFRFSPEWRTEASFEPATFTSCAELQSTTVRQQVGLDLFWERRY